MLHDDTLAAQDSPFDIDVGEDEEDEDEDDENDEGEEDDEEGGWQVGRGTPPA